MIKCVMIHIYCMIFREYMKAEIKYFKIKQKPQIINRKIQFNIFVYLS